MNMKPIFNSYFSGAGLMDGGLIDAGIEISQSFELDADACKTHAANFDHEVVQCDLTQKLAYDEFACHGMVFTYPCTKYSTAADIHGTRTGDELFLHAFRHMALRLPEVFIIENVPGMKKFPIVMEAMKELPSYYVHEFCPAKAEWFVPQRRDRLILIGSRKPFAWQPPQGHRSTQLKDILEADPDIGQYPSSIAKRMNGTFRDQPIISNPIKNDVAPTCLAHYGKDRSTRVVADDRFDYGVRPYTVREYARLQGVPDWFKFPVNNTEAYKQIGNGVEWNKARWIGSEVMRYFNKNTNNVAFH